MKILAMLGVAMMATMAWADGGFAYQGSLYSADGKAIATKSVTIVFRLYDGAESTTELWARKISVRTDTDGFFNVEIDDSQGVWVGTNELTTVAYVLRETAQKNKALYLGLTVEGSTGEIRPRQVLQSVPQASFAADGFESSDETFAVGGAMTVNGATAFGGDVTFEDGAVFSDAVTVSKEALVTNAVFSFTGSSALTVGSCCAMPVNTIIMWWGETGNIPKGWTLCDGTKGTPDLRGVFPLGGGTGANDRKKGDTGGQATVTLSIDNLPSHAHRYANDKNIDDIEGPYRKQGDYDGRRAYGDDSNNNLHYYQTSSVGGSNSHNNMPPYLAVHFIMRVQ